MKITVSKTVQEDGKAVCETIKTFNNAIELMSLTPTEFAKVIIPESPPEKRTLISIDFDPEN